MSESHPNGLPSRVTATITKVLSMTMSVVLEVTLQARHGPTTHHVLKLYDRRFGSSLRHDGIKNKPTPYTKANEVAFQTFVRRGMMPEFLEDLKNRSETRGIAIAAWEFLDESHRTDEGLAKHEATLWQVCMEHFQCETRAYNRLADLQGKLIPRMLAHVRLPVPINPPTIPQEAAPYLVVRGILLERIDGYCLEDLTRGPLPSSLRKWHQVIQSAADAAHEIEQRGVIMDDCAPRNVVVDRQSNTPRIVDLAQCRFRDVMVREWHEWEWDTEAGWDSDVEYWKEVSSAASPWAIGSTMARLVEERTHVKMEIKCPNYEAIIAGVCRKKAEKAASAAAAERKKAPRKSR